jgi:hypothetical protein
MIENNILYRPVYRKLFQITVWWFKHNLLLLDGLKQRVLNDLWRARLSRRRIIWLLGHPSPPINKFNRRHTGRLRKRTNFTRKRGEGGWRGAKSYDREEAWPSINHSILSGLKTPYSRQTCSTTRQDITRRI